MSTKGILKPIITQCLKKSLKKSHILQHCERSELRLFPNEIFLNFHFTKNQNFFQLKYLFKKIIFGGKIQIWDNFGVIFKPFYFNISPFLPAFPEWKMEMRRRRRLLLLHTEKSPFCFLSSVLSLKEGRQQSFHFPACLPKVITHIKDEVYRPNCLKDPNTPSTAFENHQKCITLIFTPKKKIKEIEK